MFCQSFYDLKSTTRNYIDILYIATMSRQTLPKLDSYCGILVALRFLGANGQTDPVDLLIEFLRDKNKSVFINHDKLRREAAKHRWTLHDLRRIAADWFQGKDEDKLLRLAKAVRQKHARYAVATPPHISINGEPITISWEIQASILQAWEESAAEESPYRRLKQSLRLLGVPDKKEECTVIYWFCKKNRLRLSQLRKYLWEPKHLEIIAITWMAARGSRTAMKIAPAWLAEDRPNSAESRLEESRGQLGHLPRIHETVGTQKQRSRDENAHEGPPVPACTSKRGIFTDTTTKRYIADLQKAYKAATATLDAAKKANDDNKKRLDDVKKAHNTCAWETTKLITNFLQPQKRYPSGAFVMPGRYLEPNQGVRYPWRECK
jgi:hypothetical protein